MKLINVVVSTVLLALLASRAVAGSELENWVASPGFKVIPDIVYHTADGHQNKLDVYLPTGAAGLLPTVIYFHGGGWVRTQKEQVIPMVLPYLQMGMAVVNVDYRLAGVALAPAAVEDARCALRWVYKHADDYSFDLNRILVSGNSAGGHLALMAGLLKREDGLDYGCRIFKRLSYQTFNVATAKHLEMKVSAIVNFYGITDVLAVLEGDGAKFYAEEWFGTLPNRTQLAKRLSPVNYVRGDAPPILTVHGEQDRAVPYQQAVKLHERLSRAGVPAQLYSVKSGAHGSFPPADNHAIWDEVRRFIERYIDD